jgi:hypothetical protein
LAPEIAFGGVEGRRCAAAVLGDRLRRRAGSVSRAGVSLRRVLMGGMRLGRTSEPVDGGEWWRSPLRGGCSCCRLRRSARVGVVGAGVCRLGGRSPLRGGCSSGRLRRRARIGVPSQRDLRHGRCAVVGWTRLRAGCSCGRLGQCARTGVRGGVLGDRDRVGWGVSGWVSVPSGWWAVGGAGRRASRRLLRRPPSVGCADGVGVVGAGTAPDGCHGLTPLRRIRGDIPLSCVFSPAIPGENPPFERISPRTAGVVGCPGSGRSLAVSGVVSAL